MEFDREAPVAGRGLCSPVRLPEREAAARESYCAQITVFGADGAAAGQLRTSLRLERGVFEAWEAMLESLGVSEADLLGHIDLARGQADRTAALRVVVVEYWRRRAGGDAPTLADVAGWLLPQTRSVGRRQRQRGRKQAGKPEIR